MSAPRASQARRAVAGAALLLLGLPLAAGPGAGMHGVDVLLVVDDGVLLYDTDGDCAGDTDAPPPGQGAALHRWDLGLPLLGAGDERGGGGCLGGPRTWQVHVDPGHHGRLDGVVRYTRDATAAGAGLVPAGNEVHLHIYDANGDLVTSTLFTEGPRPAVPGTLGLLDVQEHVIGHVIEAGDYTLVEDVWAGEHTAWVTSFVMIQG